jgi:Flp pilus assembly protein TadG
MNFMTRKNTPPRKWNAGASAIEFALVIPILLLVLGGAMDMGRYFWTQHVTNQAAWEGVRLAALSNSSDSQVITRVHQHLLDGGINSPPTVTVAQSGVGNDVTVSVEIASSYFLLDKAIGFMQSLSSPDEEEPFPSTYYVRSSAVMTKEL